MSPPTQYRLSGRQFCRLNDPTNSIKVLKENSWPATDRKMLKSQNPPGASHRVTSESLKKKNITVGPAQRDKAPHSRLPVQVLYRTIDCATIDATQHFDQ